MSIYNYILTHEGFYSLTLLNGILPKGVCHADDLFYLWKPFFGYEIPLFGEDVSVSEILIGPDHIQVNCSLKLIVDRK